MNGNMNIICLDILTILVLLIHEHEISFHLFVSSLISFINILQFSVYRSFTFLVKFIPRYFILFDAILNGIIFFISLIVYYCIEMPPISVFQLCILWLYWIYLLGLTVFLVQSLGFSLYNVMSPAKWHFYFFLFNIFSLFFLVIAVTRSSDALMNKSGKSGHHCLSLILEEMLSAFHYWIWC